MLPPQLLNICLECRAEGTEVVKAGASAVYVERGRVEELSFEQVFARDACIL